MAGNIKNNVFCPSAAPHYTMLQGRVTLLLPDYWWRVGQILISGRVGVGICVGILNVGMVVDRCWCCC